VSKWLNNLIQLNKATVLSENERCKLEFFQGTEDDPSTMNESVFTNAQNENNDNGTQLDRANLISLDREYFDYVKSGSFGRNPDADFAWLDDWTERRFGVNGGGKGRMWNRSPNKQPFTSPWEYSGKIEEMLNKGYETITTPEEKAWFAAEKSGSREEKIKVVSKYYCELTSKTKEEVDFELEKFDVKVKSQNFSANFLAFAHDFTQDEKNIVYAALYSGDGIPYSHVNQYKTLIQANKDKGERVSYLINLSRCDSYDFFPRIFRNTMLIRVCADIKGALLKWFDR
jgi:hypothetical protein